MCELLTPLIRQYEAGIFAAASLLAIRLPTPERARKARWYGRFARGGRFPRIRRRVRPRLAGTCSDAIAGCS
jgi:hypothetical protein